MSVLDDLKHKPFPVLDRGSVELIDAMGSDQSIANAARRSYGQGTRSVSDDRTLLRLLMRKHHSSPFEMASVVLLIRAPIVVWRQVERHRAGRLVDEQCCWDDPSVNELSGRYSVMPDAMQATEPGAWRLQATGNKQGSAGSLAEWTGEDGGPDRRNPASEYRLDHEARLAARRPTDEPMSPGEALSIVEAAHHEEARRVYEQRLALGVAREQARKDLPLSTYTEAVVCFDLRNLLHFLALRLAPEAQEEVRAYARVIADIVGALFPLTWGAFADYVRGAVTLSHLDVQVIRQLAGFTPPVTGDLFREAVEWAVVGWGDERCRERDECLAKLVRLGLVEGDA